MRWKENTMFIPKIRYDRHDTSDDSTSPKDILGYWRYDALTKTFTISDELKKALHLTGLEQNLWFQHIHPEDLPWVKQLFAYATEHNENFSSIHRIQIGDSLHWISVRSRVDVVSGKLVGFIGTVEDITKSIAKELDSVSEITKLKLELEKLNNKMIDLTQQNKRNSDVKSGFLSAMSHEIRTPMNAMIGFTHLLQETKLSGEQEEYVMRINDASTHLLSIINDILDLSKMEAGKMLIEKRTFRLDKMINDVRDLLIQSAQRKHLYLDIETMNCPDVLIGDSVRIKQILINLLSNAIKFTETGGISLVISGENKTDEHIQMSFKIKDTGIGMTSEQQQRLFQEFEQADQSTSRIYGGTGLGLSISKRLASLMQGTITVESKLNEGSTFTLQIPLETVMHDEEVVTEVYHEQIKEHPHILVAEDHILSQKLTERLLQNLGAHVKIVDNGEKAVQALKDKSYDLVFLDMNMPVLDGLQAAEQIRRFNKKTPLLALTANQYAEERAACLLAGMNDILIKPIDSKTLYQALIKWIPEE